MSTERSIFMYDLEKQKARVKIKYPEAQDAQIEFELDMAAEAINERRGYVPTEEQPIEDKYLGLQVLLVVEALSKYGAEGEKSHSDNGVSRVYENGSPYSDTLLNRIIPLGTSFKS